VKAKRLLLVDDSRFIRRITRSYIEEAGLFDEIFEAADGEAALAIANEKRVDLVLCDLDMPILDGFGFLARFRETFDAPVLMLSARNDPAVKVRGFALGANDYVGKPCDPAELCARVANYLRLKLTADALAESTRQLEQTNRELARLARTDGLTGLANRRHFMARGEEEHERAARYGRTPSLLLIDVDHFKRINDTFGHPQGDAVLVGLARALESSIRATDLAARFGGEEFVVLLPETGGKEAVEVAERLRETIARSHFDGMDRHITVSVGVAAQRPGELVADQLRRADLALYAAKSRGRNCVVVTDVESDRESDRETDREIAFLAKVA
jgi:two-component system, cell cycle response regulator